MELSQQFCSVAYTETIDAPSIWVAGNNELETVVFRRKWTAIALSVHHDFFDHSQSFSGVSFVKKQNGIYVMFTVFDGHRLCEKDISFYVFKGCTAVNLWNKRKWNP